MFNINNKNVKIVEQKIFIGNCKRGEITGYDICIELSFINLDSNEKGYMHVDTGFEKDNNVKAFLNKTYCGVPFVDVDPFIYFEIYDTEKFYDTEIESEITIKIGDVKDNKVLVYIELNDELVTLKFDDYLDLIER